MSVTFWKCLGPSMLQKKQTTALCEDYVHLAKTWRPPIQKWSFCHCLRRHNTQSIWKWFLSKTMKLKQGVASGILSYTYTMINAINHWPHLFYILLFVKWTPPVPFSCRAVQSIYLSVILALLILEHYARECLFWNFDERNKKTKKQTIQFKKKNTKFLAEFLIK